MLLSAIDGDYYRDTELVKGQQMNNNGCPDSTDASTKQPLHPGCREKCRSEDGKKVRAGGPQCLLKTYLLDMIGKRPP